MTLVHWTVVLRILNYLRDTIFHSHSPPLWSCLPTMMPIIVAIIHIVSRLLTFISSWVILLYSGE